MPRARVPRGSWEREKGRVRYKRKSEEKLKIGKKTKALEDTIIEREILEHHAVTIDMTMMMMMMI